MDIAGIITKELSISRWQAEAVIRLIDEGNTIPFIARYRKEAHGNMNDEQLRAFDERLQYLRNLEERKETVLAAIEKQGKLTDELQEAIDKAQTQTEVEDLYRPYRQKRRTRAAIAREAGLEPLAAYLLSENTPRPVPEEAKKYVHQEDASGASVPDVPTAIRMAEDILAEQISDNAQYRDWIRQEIWKDGLLLSGKAARKEEDSKATGSTRKEADSKAAGGTGKEAGTAGTGKAAAAKAPAASKVHNKKLEGREEVYENYFDFSEPLAKIPGHRILAINRGEKEKFLTVHIEAPEEKITAYLYRQLNLRPRQQHVQTDRSADRKVRKGLGGNPFANIHLEPSGTKNRSANLNRVAGSRSAAGKAEQQGSSMIFRENPVTSQYLHEAVADAWKRLVAPSMETEIRNSLTEQAEEGAIKVFASNLEQLLMQPPVTGKVVLGWDPAFRTGCKLAVVDETGKVLDTTVIFPTEPQNKVAEAKQTLKRLYDKYHYTLISCGNGTASRESEQVIADFIRETKLPIQYVITNEAGASVYSASALATEEFPNFDVGQRSAASIARRVQDPLAELVKIDPKSIGVGQYQHDMNQTKLGDTLTGVVEDCVNRVGVDANTASAALLSYISGLNKSTARNMVAWREENGRFTNRRQFLKVKGLGAKAYEQAAGFLRIRGGSEPLDMTAVHPESYEAARKLLEELGYSKEDVAAGKTADIEKRAAGYAVRGKDTGHVAATGKSSSSFPGSILPSTDAGHAAAGKGAAHRTGSSLAQLSEDTGLGEYTLKDVLAELEKPGRDPREEIQGPVLRRDVLSIKDLKPGMVLKGTVRNIVDFGAFVDIGVHQDGLVHISQLSSSYVKHPLDVVKVGDIVNVRVLAVDEARNRISLSMKEA